jgi:hypothetical protein
MILLANCSRFHPLSRAEEPLLPVTSNSHRLSYSGRTCDLQPLRYAAAVKRVSFHLRHRGGSTFSSLTHHLEKKLITFSCSVRKLRKLCWNLCWKYLETNFVIMSYQNNFNNFGNTFTLKYYIECSLCRLIRRTEYLIGRHWYLPTNWRSFIRWLPDQWVSQFYPFQCYKSFYCALFCAFMNRVSQPIILRANTR